jgi:hypothetical protein
VLSGVVHQDPTHYLSSDTEEVCTVLPFYVALVDQLHVSLMNQRRRLQRVVSSLAAQIAPRQPTQFIVDVRKYEINYILISFRQLNEHLGDLRSFFVVHMGGCVLRDYSLRAVHIKIVQVVISIAKTIRV